MILHTELQISSLGYLWYNYCFQSKQLYFQLQTVNLAIPRIVSLTKWLTLICVCMFFWCIDFREVNNFDITFRHFIPSQDFICPKNGLSENSQIGNFGAQLSNLSNLELQVAMVQHLLPFVFHISKSRSSQRALILILNSRI